jgi:N-methylhydantoinase A/oxoprolinase/acetone carboxylase beta subunit
MYVVGVDVGGTFTDVVVYDTETREWRLTKVPSTPPHFTEGFVEGVAQACSGSRAGASRRSAASSMARPSRPTRSWSTAGRDSGS